MYHHISHKKALPILKDISYYLTDNQYIELINEDFFLTNTHNVNLMEINDHKEMNSYYIPTIEKNIKWGEFLNILKEYPKGNDYLFLKSIKPVDNKRIALIEMLLEEENIYEKFFTIKYNTTKICPILHAPYLKNKQEN